MFKFVARFLSLFTETAECADSIARLEVKMGMIEEGTDNICLHSVAKITLQKGERRRKKRVRESINFQKHSVAPLGVILKNENKQDEIIDILSGIHHYVHSAGDCFTRLMKVQ